MIPPRTALLLAALLAPLAPALGAEAAAAPAPAAGSLRVVASVGLDRGPRLQSGVTRLDGREIPLQAGGGWVVAVGAAVPVDWAPGLEVQATLGWRGATERDPTYEARALAFPLEVLFAWGDGPFRFAAGPTLTLAPTYHGSGQAVNLQVDRAASPGLVFQAAWTFGGPEAAVRGALALRGGALYEPSWGRSSEQLAFTWGVRVEAFL